MYIDLIYTFSTALREPVLVCLPPLYTSRPSSTVVEACTSLTHGNSICVHFVDAGIQSTICNRPAIATCFIPS